MERWQHDNEVNKQKIEMLDRDKGMLLKDYDSFKNIMESYVETNERLRENNELLWLTFINEQGLHEVYEC